MAPMSFTERANKVRKRIPFAYWLFYDLVIAPFLVWGIVSVSWLFTIPVVPFLVAVFFDLNEAVVKWSRRRSP